MRRVRQKICSFSKFQAHNGWKRGSRPIWEKRFLLSLFIIYLPTGGVSSVQLLFCGVWNIPSEHKTIILCLLFFIPNKSRQAFRTNLSRVTICTVCLLSTCRFRINCFVLYLYSKVTEIERTKVSKTRFHTRKTFFKHSVRSSSKLLQSVRLIIKGTGEHWTF